MTYSIDLPFPISANRLWRSASAAMHTRRGPVLGAPRVYLSKQYRAWIAEADALFLTQKERLRPIEKMGGYCAVMTFAHQKRSPIADGDNLCKCVHDYLQRVELIHNDCLCDSSAWGWGEAPTGCHVRLVGHVWHA